MERTMQTRRTLGVILSVALGIALLWAFVAAQPTVATTAAPSTTESITITKYAADGTTIIAQETITYGEMEAILDVQGDGVTHYYFQGPTFDPGNLWDPDETLNLKNKGAIKGTDIKDLVELVGGAEAGDQIEIKAIDNYGDSFPYDNVYNPDPAQGKMVVAWYTKNAGDDHNLYPEGAYVPEFGDGMQLIFLAQTTNGDGKHVFGHDDMRDHLLPENRHYFYSGGTQYPSANGVSIKYISQINVYSQAPGPWSIDVTGAVTTPVSQSWFENALACHEVVTWTDGGGDVWSGLPLWYMLGLADDEYVHGIGSFNDALAKAGYDIEVRAEDDYTQWFESEDVRRSSGYVVANLMNGKPLTDSYPLRLVGSALTSGSQRVSNIASINLYNIPDIETWTVKLSGATTYTMTQAEFDNAVICPTIGHSAVYTDGDGDIYEGIPLWLLVGWVDDDDAHGPDSFNDGLANRGYDVRVIATDGFSYTFPISDVARNDNIIVASTVNGLELPSGEYPLRLVGSDVTLGKQRIKQIAEIELLDLPGLDHQVFLPLVNKASSAWDLELSGAMTTTLTAPEFESEATDHPSSWDDGLGSTYGGLALWRLVGMVDDANPNTFNDQLAALGYQVKVIAVDDYSYTFQASDIPKDDGIVVASTLNGSALPDDEYPLRLVGSALVSGGQRVKKIARIELLNLPTVTPDWELDLSGAMTTTLTAAEFATEAGDHPASYDDGSGNLYGGVALWRLVGMVDDGDPDTFDDATAALGYDVSVIATDGFSYTFPISDVARNNDIIVANVVNGGELPADAYPVRLVGSALTSNKQKVRQIASIELTGLPPDWELDLSGAMTTTMTAVEFQTEAADHPASYDDGMGSVYGGVALWRLVGMIDDGDPDTFDDATAALGYDVGVIATDGFSYTFPISDVARNNDIIVANVVNGGELPADAYPVRLVGSALTSNKQKVRQIASIELAGLPAVRETPYSRLFER
jgi:hypothetical protein